MNLPFGSLFKERGGQGRFGTLDGHAKIARAESVGRERRSRWTGTHRGACGTWRSGQSEGEGRTLKEHRR
ncbi:MAG: hypothetical protein IJX92_06585 [Clostridia bacterium]|nr:hypothetical protein [Clostridia bacterium]